jgi:hypothetical protein
MLPSIIEPALFRHLASCKRVLIAGAGGGFDVFAGLPLAHALWNRGQTAFLANLSFAAVAASDASNPVPGLYEVTPATSPLPYFPERSLARFLESQKLPSTVWAFARNGPAQVFNGYQWLATELDLDAVVLVDGGTDILMFGDEDGLGTPIEDMTSLAAIGQLRIAHRHVACLGFGVDAYHGVSHAHVLENIAALERDGAYHGTFSLPRFSLEGDLYLRAVAAAQLEHPGVQSIVNGSIAAAMEGQFGDVRFTERTSDSELFINPLMALYFTFDLMGLCHHNLYLRQLVGAPSQVHVSMIIEGFREGLKTRPRRVIPH